MGQVDDDLPVKAPRPHGTPRSKRTKVSRAAWMRANPTLGEQSFSMLLATLGVDIEFQAQVVVAGYIVDF